MSNFFLILSFSECNKNRVRGQILKTVVVYFPSCSNLSTTYPSLRKFDRLYMKTLYLVIFRGKGKDAATICHHCLHWPQTEKNERRKRRRNIFFLNPKLSIVKGLWKNTAHSSLFHNNSLINFFSFFIKSSFENFVPGCIADPDYCSHWSGYQKSRLCLSQFFAKNIEKFDTDHSCE